MAIYRVVIHKDDFVLHKNAYEQAAKHINKEFFLNFEQVVWLLASRKESKEFLSKLTDKQKYTKAGKTKKIDLGPELGIVSSGLMRSIVFVKRC